MFSFMIWAALATQQQAREAMEPKYSIPKPVIMRRSFLSLVVLAFLLPVVFAADPVVVVPTPEAPKWTEFKADVGDLITLSLPGMTDKGTWVLVDEGASIKPCGNGKECSFAAKRPGKYRLLVTTATETHRVAVIVGPPQPMPPDPKPPEPKPPEPKPPEPIDAFRRAVQDAYTADTANPVKKQGELLDLVELYTQAVTLAGDKTVMSVGQLVQRLRDATKALGITGLEAVRKLIAAELVAAFPADTTLDDSSRSKAAALMGRIRDVLKEVK